MIFGERYALLEIIIFLVLGIVCLVFVFCDCFIDDNKRKYHEYVVFEAYERRRDRFKDLCASESCHPWILRKTKRNWEELRNLTIRCFDDDMGMINPSKLSRIEAILKKYGCHEIYFASDGNPLHKMRNVLPFFKGVGCDTLISPRYLVTQKIDHGTYKGVRVINLTLYLCKKRVTTRHDSPGSATVGVLYYWIDDREKATVFDAADGPAMAHQVNGFLSLLGTPDHFLIMDRKFPSFRPDTMEYADLFKDHNMFTFDDCRRCRNPQKFGFMPFNPRDWKHTELPIRRSQNGKRTKAKT